MDLIYPAQYPFCSPSGSCLTTTKLAQKRKLEDPAVTGRSQKRACAGSSIEIHQPSPVSTTLATKVQCWLETVERERGPERLEQRPTSAPPELAIMMPPPTTPSQRRNSQSTTAPASTQGTSVSKRTSSNDLVSRKDYRNLNLYTNGIRQRMRSEQLPTNIEGLIERINRARDSPPPDLNALECIELGRQEEDVTALLSNKLLPGSDYDPDKLCIDRNGIMPNTAVPSLNQERIVSTPKPDFQYGYGVTQFPPQETALLDKARALSTARTLLPFLIIEVKGEGPNTSLWVATNQALGGSATAINLTKNLRNKLQECCSAEEVKAIDDTTFIVAMNGTEARLMVSWSPDAETYLTQTVEQFALMKEEDAVKFRHRLRNICDWGRNERLEGIRKLLNEYIKLKTTIGTSERKGRPAPDEETQRSRPAPYDGESRTAEATEQ